MEIPDIVIEELFYTSDAKTIRELRATSEQHMRVYREKINWLLLARYENYDEHVDPETLEQRNKHEQLQIFIDYFDYLPPQGSKAWARSREAADHLPPIIGGSEIHKIARGTPSEKKELYKAKLGLSGFTGNKWTHWGNLFEPMIQLYCDIILNTTTYETGSIPGLRDESGNVIQSYSPDGLNVVHIDTYALRAAHGDTRGDRTIPELIQEWKEKVRSYAINREIIALMEYKCPPSRIPDGKVPSQYYSQPRTGACTIDIVDACLFVDASFRRCSYTQFAEGIMYNHDPNLHSRDCENTFADVEEPLAYGLIGVYDTSQPYSEPALEDDVDPNADESSEEFFSDLSDDIEQLRLKPHLRTSDEWRIDPGDLEESETESESEDLDEESTPGEPLTEAHHDQIAGVVKSRVLNLINVNLIAQNLVQISHLTWLYLYSTTYKSDNIQRRDSEDTWEIVRRIMPNVNSKNERTYRGIVSSTVNLCVLSKASDMRRYAGKDFGEPKNNYEFLDVMAKSIDSRYAKRGYKLFYPTQVFTEIAGYEYFNAELAEELHKDGLRAYLDQYLYQFVSECRARNAKPIGFIPWKLLKVSMVPIEKEPDFVNNIEKKVRDAAADILDIRLQTKDIPEYEERCDIRQRMVETRCPVRTRAPRAPRAPKAAGTSDTEAEEQIVAHQSDLDALGGL